MTRWKWQSIWSTKMALALAIAGAILTLAGSESAAKEPPDRAEIKTVEGTVDSTTTAPRGEIDGAVLNDGTIIHWPPHREERFSNVVKKGSRVKVVGRSEINREGERRLEVNRLTNIDTNATVENDEPGPRGKKGKAPTPPPKRRSAAKTLEGVVERLTTAPKGETDGAVLKDGTVLHWPPHLESGFATLAAKGARVKATGFAEMTPRGDEYFEVQSLTNLDTNKSFENDENDRARPDERRADRDRGEESASRSERIREIKEELRRLQREIDRLEREE